jgi:hypothetical protein
MPPPFNFSASVLNNFQFLLEHILADLASVGVTEGLGFRFSRVRSQAAARMFAWIGKNPLTRSSPNNLGIALSRIDYPFIAPKCAS